MFLGTWPCPHTNKVVYMSHSLVYEIIKVTKQCLLFAIIIYQHTHLYVCKYICNNYENVIYEDGGERAGNWYE